MPARTGGRRAEERGPTRAGIEPEHEATLLFASTTGLILGLLTGDQAMAAIDYRLGRIFKRHR